MPACWATACSALCLAPSDLEVETAQPLRARSLHAPSPASGFSGEAGRPGQSKPTCMSARTVRQPGGSSSQQRFPLWPPRIGDPGPLITGKDCRRQRTWTLTPRSPGPPPALLWLCDRHAARLQYELATFPNRSTHSTGLSSPVCPAQLSHPCSVLCRAVSAHPPAAPTDQSASSWAAGTPLGSSSGGPHRVTLLPLQRPRPDEDAAARSLALPFPRPCSCALAFGASLTLSPSLSPHLPGASAARSQAQARGHSPPPA